MNRKKFSVYGVFSVVSILLFIMSVSVFIFNPVLALINTAITLILVLIGFAVLKNYDGYLKNISDNVKKFIDSDFSNILDGMPTPIAVVEKNNLGNMVFCNSEFKNVFINNTFEFSLNSVISIKALSDFVNSAFRNSDYSNEHIRISYNNKKFKIYIKAINNFVVLYFTDDTEYRELRKKYIDSRPCVGFVLFDNKEELKRYSTDEQNSQIAISVENMLREWMNGINGILKKLNDEKYFIIFEEKFLKQFIDDKFKIIDKIHNAKIDEHRFATVSIGISRGEENLEKSKDEAKSALNMSLGRGGDQVTIKNKNSYEFFGGTSQGIEKRSKVKTRVVAMNLLEKIQNSDSVFIMGHKYSDFDSIGAAAAIWSICSKLKKKASYIVVNKAQSLANSAINYLEKTVSENMFISTSQAKNLIMPNSLLIIVDTHSLNFLESSHLYSKINRVAVIDHHRLAVDKISNAEIFFHEPFASSTCEMVSELIQYMGDKCLKKPEFECLLAGIMLDTKNFTLKSGVRTFEAAAYLKRRGADNSKVKKIFASSFDSYKLKCRIIENTKIIENCAISRFEEKLSESIKKNIRISCSQAADELLNLQDVKASFVIFESDNKVNISARSFGEVNVQVIMELLGGGGHQTMAAAQISDMSFDAVEKKLIEIIKEKNNK